MYDDFKRNFAITLLRYKIITIHFIDGDILRLGYNYTPIESVFPRPFGFYIERGSSVVWYSYSSIKKIEAFGNEYQRADPFDG